MAGLRPEQQRAELSPAQSGSVLMLFGDRCYEYSALHESSGATIVHCPIIAEQAYQIIGFQTDKLGCSLDCMLN